MADGFSGLVGSDWSRRGGLGVLLLGGSYLGKLIFYFGKNFRVMSNIKLNDDTRHRLFMERMKDSLKEAVDECFSVNRDVEVSWSVFRDHLRKLKKAHKESYEKYMETDAD